MYQKRDYSETASVGQSEWYWDKPGLWQIYTSGKYHLAPFLAATAIRSLVGTCCTAKGLIEATARLMESFLSSRGTSVWGKPTLLVIEVWVKGFMDFDRGVDLEGSLCWGSLLV